MTLGIKSTKNKVAEGKNQPEKTTMKKQKTKIKQDFRGRRKGRKSLIGVKLIYIYIYFK